MIDKLRKDSIILIAIGLGIPRWRLLLSLPPRWSGGFGVLAPGGAAGPVLLLPHPGPPAGWQEAQQRAFSINMKDERKVFLRARAGQIAFTKFSFTPAAVGAVGPCSK